MENGEELTNEGDSDEGFVDSEYPENQLEEIAVDEIDQNNQVEQAKMKSKRQLVARQSKVKEEAKKKLKNKFYLRIASILAPTCLFLMFWIIVTVGAIATVAYVAEKAAVPITVDSEGKYVAPMPTN